MWLFLVLLAVPIVEIALFIQVGDLIGTWRTIAIVVVTALIGAAALRLQGRAMMQRAQGAFQTPDDIPNVVGESLMLFAAGILLLTPGFLTDTIGALFLFPPSRRWIWRRIAAKAAVHVAGSVFTQQNRDDDPVGRERSSTQPPYEPRQPADGGPRPEPTPDVEDAIILDENSRKRP